MALFYTAMRSYSVSLFRFPFLRYVQIISREIPLICHLKFVTIIRVFFTATLAYVLSMKYEGQQISSYLQDSFEYSSQS